MKSVGKGETMTTQMWVTVFASLISSGLIGAMLSVIIYGKREKRRFKVDTLKKLAASRYDVTSDEFRKALNEIFVVFNDSPNVMQTLSEFHQAVVGKQADKVVEDGLMKLFKVMCKDAGIEYNYFNDSFFLHPFSSKQPIPPIPNIG